MLLSLLSLPYYDLRNRTAANATATAPTNVTPVTATTTANKNTLTFVKPPQRVRAKLHLQGNTDQINNDKNVQNNTHDIGTEVK